MSNDKPFYVTTPIYYVNDKPHIGHAYSTVAADMLARYQKLRGRPVRFLTGTDEHGQKIEQSAEAQKIDPQAFVDRMSPPFREAFEAYRCEFDDYIRTTEPRHKKKVQALWDKLVDNGDIYLGEYEGWYSVKDEAFITEQQLKELDEVTRAGVQKVKEKSYFFKLSAYTDKLLKFYEDHPTFVQPEGRFNEVKSFVKGELRDLSISRSTFKWGVPVPRDPEHVMYVWLDALTNYASALGGPIVDDETPHDLFDTFWNGDVIHIVGKDILRFHAIYWPAFLLSAGVKPPTQIWAHGWLTINGQKMGKRYNNFLPPIPLAEAYGEDVVRYYLMREIAFGQDGDFSHKNIVARYNGELANGLGNLLNRMVASIVKKSLGGVVPEVDVATLPELDQQLIALAKNAASRAAGHLDNITPHRALDTIWELVSAANKYVDQTEPWALAKLEDKTRLKEVAYVVMESLRWLAVMLWPFLPSKCDGLRAQLGMPALMPTEGQDLWPAEFGGLTAGTQTAPGTPLFPRIDADKEKELLVRLGVTTPEEPKEQKKVGKKKAQKQAAAEAEASGDFIAFDDFQKVDLRLGLVVAAEEVKKSKRLLKLQIDEGDGKTRQILAGIKEHYSADDLIGKRVVFVANLAPRKMMGLLSEGMVLAASDDNGLSVLSVDKDITPGVKVK